MKRRAVFLDRDGTLIRDKEYLHLPEELELFPETVPALRLLQQCGFALVVISNQSGVARGYFTEVEVEVVNGEMSRQLQREGVNLTGIYYCPHLEGGVVESYAVACDCRKPAPGLVRRAARELDLELEGSWMVGDKSCDIDLGLNAGLRSVLVRTGYGAEVEPVAGSVAVVDDILAAARLIASQEGNLENSQRQR